MQEPQNTAVLPAGYRHLYTINLQSDKKLALLINGIALAIMLVMFVIGLFIVPFDALFVDDGSFVSMILRWIVLLVLIFIYLAAHEMVHGILMKRYSDIKVSYGFTGLYAYAGSKAFFNKKSYIIIALAPIVIWGIVLAVVNCLVPASWWWVVYFIQIMNISGGAGDLYVFWRFCQLPDYILIQDTGIEMSVYVPDLKSKHQA